MKTDIVSFIQKHSLSINPNDPAIEKLLANTTRQVSFTLRPDDDSGIKKIRIYVLVSPAIENPIRSGSFWNSLKSERKKDEVEHIFVEITDENSQKILKRFDISHDQELYSLLKQEGVENEVAFEKPYEPAIVWNSDMPLAGTYDEKKEKSYKKIREKIASETLSALAMIHPDTVSEILLIDVSTGLGDCLDATAKKLQENGYQIRSAVGTDISPANLEMAKKKFSENPLYSFQQADTKNITTIVENNKKPHDFVIITGSGAITRLVFNNTLEALIFFQQAYREADLVVVGGLTGMLITQKIAKHIGWHTDLISRTKSSTLDSASSIYVFSHQEIQLPKIKNEHLDLSFHANPLSVLLKMPAADTRRIFSLDLGMAFIKSEELKNILAKLPNLKKIKISGMEDWYFAFVAEATKNPKIEIILDSAAYVDTQIADSRYWELKKHSPQFYERTSTLFGRNPEKNIVDLAQKSNLPMYAIDEGKKKEKLEASIALLVDKAKNDDVALYKLAKAYEGTPYTYNQGSYVKRGTFQNYFESFSYWQQLAAKGYDVVDDLKRVQEEIRKINPFAEELVMDLQAIRLGKG